MNVVKRAIFIAAGEGSRLRPVTNECPKPLIKINGESFIDRSIRILRSKGVQEFYVVVGYLSEKFEEHFADCPDVHLIHNPNYKKGNNITSMFEARKYLPESMVFEADILVQDEDVLNPEFEDSCYLATYLEDCPEWAIRVEDGRIVSYDVAGGKHRHRLWGISLWNREVGEILARKVESEYLAGNWNQYWDDIALTSVVQECRVGVREISDNALCEIDTLQELIAADETYVCFA